MLRIWRSCGRDYDGEKAKVRNKRVRAMGDSYFFTAHHLGYGVMCIIHYTDVNKSIPLFKVEIVDPLGSKTKIYE